MSDINTNALSDLLLSVLRRRPARFHSLEALSKVLKVEKADLLFAIDLLRQTGYEIKPDSQGRYAFISAPDNLLAIEITNDLKTVRIGKTVYAYKSVQSTNTVAARLAGVNAPEGTVVIAETQTKGRGRLGRSWFSLEEKGIYLSIIIYPDIDPSKTPGISIMTALSLADTIQSYDSLEVGIKWPNDCLINGRKVAGILTELSAEVGKVHHVIVGVGINVNHRRQDFPPDIAKIATSLRAEMKEPVRRVEFVQRFLKQFEADYRLFQKSGLKPLRKRILKYSVLLGKKVKIDLKGSVVTGTAVDIDENGNLVLDTTQGLRPFNAGEVTIIRRT